MNRHFRVSMLPNPIGLPTSPPCGYVCLLIQTKGRRNALIKFVENIMKIKEVKELINETLANIQECLQ